MTLTLNAPRSELLSALAALQNITNKKGTLAVLTNLLLESKKEGLLLTATDLEIGIRYLVPAEILSEGAITLPARKLFELVRESGGEQIHLEEMENSWVRITADASSYNLAGIPAEEFPAFPLYQEENLAIVPAEIIADLIDRTIFSVAPETENQFTMAGLLLEREIIDEGHFLRMVSTDGHRLTMMEKKVDGDLSGLNMDRIILVPRKGAQELRKLCELEENLSLGIEEKQMVIKVNQGVMVIRLMNGDFPNYKMLIEAVDKSKHMIMERLPLMQSLKRVNIFTEDRFNSVHFLMEKHKLTLASQNMDIGNAKEEITTTYEGEPMQLGFNGKYFIESLQVMESDKIKVYINSEESPCLIQGEHDHGYLSVIMPMKI